MTVNFVLGGMTFSRKKHFHFAMRINDFELIVYVKLILIKIELDINDL